MLLLDALLAVWAVVWAVIGWAVKAVVDQLAVPAEQMGATTQDLADRVGQAADSLEDVALVGEQLAAPLRPIADTLGEMTAQTARQVETVHQAGWLLFLVVWLIPVLTYAVLYLPGRIRRAREAAQARRFIDEQADLDLFALRAMAKAPMTQLARISSDPVAAWRAGDPRVIRQLADLELRRVGIGMVEQDLTTER